MSEEKRRESDPKRDTKNGRFGIGNVANPHGRPKGAVSLTGILRELMATDVPGAVQEHGMPMTYAELLVRTAVKHAAQGNPSFFREILERMDGKVPERVLSELGPNWELVFDTPREDAGPPETPPAESEAQQ